MSSFDWFNALDFKRALANLHYEFTGDWHRDPWGWPELEFLLAGGEDALRDFCNSSTASEPALLDVPKENWGTRPAVVLNPVDRLTYQALVDRLSIDIAGNLTPNAFGWRLPAISPKRGNYSHNNRQWELYRNHLSLLAGIYPVALKTDIVSCFASMSLETIQGEVDGRTPSNHVSRRLLTLLAGFNATPHRSGLPQRSTASAVIANMILIALDDVLEHHARPLSDMLKRGVQYHSFARWMDDMWLFVHDPGQARRAQVELQRAAQTVGLNLNAAKTEVLEDGTAVAEVREIEHSAVELALLLGQKGYGPLEALIDRIIDAPEKTGRTSIKFAAVRMRDHGCRHRVMELINASKRMPHAADSLAPLFKVAFTSASLQDWFLGYANENWAAFEWSTAQYARMFDSAVSPKRTIIEYFEKLVQNAGTSLPLLAVTSQRLAEWKPASARAVIRAAVRNANNPHARRVLALSALNAGEPRRVVKAWLEGHDANRITLAMLESRSYRPVSVVENYRK